MCLCAFCDFAQLAKYGGHDTLKKLVADYALPIDLPPAPPPPPEPPYVPAASVLSAAASSSSSSSSSPSFSPSVGEEEDEDECPEYLLQDDQDMLLEQAIRNGLLHLHPPLFLCAAFCFRAPCILCLLCCVFVVFVASTFTHAGVELRLLLSSSVSNKTLAVSDQLASSSSSSSSSSAAAIDEAEIDDSEISSYVRPDAEVRLCFIESIRSVFPTSFP